MKFFEKVIETRHATFRLSKGIIWHIWKPVPLDLDGAHAIGSALKTLAKGKKLPVIVDGRYATTPTGEVKEYFQSEEYNEPMFCIAAVMSSHATYIAAKLFQKFYFSPIPLKIVRTEVEAFDWFRELGLKVVANSVVGNKEDTHRDPESDLSQKLVSIIEKYAQGDFSDFNLESFSSDQTVYYFANAIQILGDAMQQQINQYKNLNEQLDQKVVERTQQLEENKKIIVEQARLASVGRFASNLSHEINNPLSIIYSASRLLSKQLASGMINEKLCAMKLDLICSTSERISGVLKTVKLLGHDGRNDPKFVESMDEMIQETVELFKGPLSEANIQLEVDVQVGAKIECRRGEIIQVLANILKNASEAFDDTNKEQKWIKIIGRFDFKQMILSISNNAPVIPLEIRGKIMEPFFTTKPFGQGTGLGLSLCRSILTFHGGEIKLIDGDHTCFTLVLPIAQQGGGT